MVHSSLVDELALAPSANWAALIKRHDLVSSYLQISKPSMVDVDSYANRAGLSRRMFYRLAKQRRERLEGKSAPGMIKGRGKPLCRDQDAMIAEAIRGAGPGAATKKVVQAVQDLSQKRGIQLPSEFAIIDRLRRGSDLRGLNERLDYAYDWIVDACATDIEIDDDAGKTDAAWIVGVVNLRSGIVVSHHFCIGTPDAADLLNVLDAPWSGENLSAILPAVVACTSAVREQAISALARRSETPRQIALYPCRRIRSGEALRYILGQKLGGVRLYSRQSVRTWRNRPAGPTLPIARIVIAELLRRAASGCTATELSEPLVAADRPRP